MNIRLIQDWEEVRGLLRDRTGPLLVLGSTGSGASLARHADPALVTRVFDLPNPIPVGTDLLLMEWAFPPVEAVATLSDLTDGFLTEETISKIRLRSGELGIAVLITSNQV